MSWIAALTDLSEFWLHWQFRAALFSGFVLWVALGTGLRSPIVRCAILIMGSWLLLAFPLLQLWLPPLEVPILPFMLLSDGSVGSVHYVLIPIVFIAGSLTCLFLARFALSLRSLIQIHKSRQDIFSKARLEAELEKQDQTVLSTFATSLQAVGLDAEKDSIELSLSSIVDMPMTYGVRLFHIGKSYIVLPENATNWSQSRLTVCLMHELWHIKRRDWLSQQVAALMQLSLVINPLAQRIQTSVIDGMETCVDKLCVQAGIDPKEYAATLLMQTKESGQSRGLFAPTFFGEYRYGDSSIQRRIGGLTGEPFGWSSLPPFVTLFIFSLLLFSALAFSSITPVKWISASQNSTNTAVYVLPTTTGSLLNREDLNIEEWPSLKAPIITKTEPDYIDIQSSYEAEPYIEKGQQPDYAFATAVFFDANKDTNGSSGAAVFSSMGMGNVEVAITPNPSHLAVPDYPVREELRNREGWVELTFDLDSAGKPIDPRIIDSSGSTRFERAAIKAILESRYSVQEREGVFLITEGLTQSYIFRLLDPGEVTPTKRSSQDSQEMVLSDSRSSSSSAVKPELIAVEQPP